MKRKLKEISVILAKTMDIHSKNSKLKKKLQELEENLNTQLWLMITRENKENLEPN